MSATTQQTTLDEITPKPDHEPQTGFNMREYERELDSIIAEVIPDKTDPLA